MIEKAFHIIAAVLVFVGGAVVLVDEVGLVGPRYIARSLSAAPTAAELEAVDRAYRAFEAVQWKREDTVLQQSRLALALADSEADEVISPLVAAMRDVRVRETAELLAKVAPLNPEAWCNLALAAMKVDKSVEKARKFFRTCVELGPREGYLFDDRLFLAMNLWYDFSEEERHAVLQDLDYGLRDRALRRFLAERMARGVLLIAPELDSTMREIILSTDERLMQFYLRALGRPIVPPPGTASTTNRLVPNRAF